MEFFNEAARFVHIFFGSVGLLAFWIPVITKKGSISHVRFGKLFAWSAYIVLAAATIALIIRIADLASRNIGPTDQPELYAFIVFLGYLTFVTFVIVRHGVQVLHHKRDPAVLRTTLNRALSIGSIVASVGIIAYALIFSPPNKILLFALSPIGFGNGYGQLRYMNGEKPGKRGWMYEHLGAMLGAGIAFHTAFGVFGSSRLFDFELTGWISVIPWIAPTVVGIPAIVLWTRHYRQKFGELA
jgi:hypothetical protein